MNGSQIRGQSNATAQCARESVMKKVITTVVCLAFLGCATSQISKQNFIQDEALKYSAGLLASDYLKSQVRGEDGSIFGTSVNFLNLHDWKTYEAEYLWDGDYTYVPSVFCRLKVENKMGGISWTDYVINMDYDASVREKGDKYNGLRIRRVREA